MDAVDILRALSGTPTVSYFERGIATLITGMSDLFELDSGTDRFGNIFVYHPNTDPQEAKVAFVAHMDHPGFEVVEALSSREYLAISHGGVARAAFEPGVKIEVVKSMDDDFPLDRIAGTVVGADDVKERGPFGSSNMVWIETSEPLENLPAAAVLDLPDFELRDGLIKGRALDDLAGCASILYALHTTKELGAPCVGIFTRAEEIGLVGARLVAESRVLPEDCAVVSVETSLKNELVKQGNGVVVRVGDIISTFDQEAESVVLSGIQGSSEPIQYQRALLSAGGCEASAFAAHGYLVTGTSLPLGAWHNQEADGSIAMEYVSESDFRSGVALITAVIEASSDEPDGGMARSLAKHPQAEAERLANDAAEWLGEI